MSESGIATNAGRFVRTNCARRGLESDALTTFNSLQPLLSRIVPSERILCRPIDRIAFASDASFYRLIPRAVVITKSIDEVRSLFQFSHQYRIPLTFRAAGTSLSGQAVSDGILVEVARHWRQVRVDAMGKRARCQSGAIGAHVNAALRAYGTKIGPDPASINACTIGGILSNNASGMCCGVGQNAYHTLNSLTFVLPSGTVIDTASADADSAFCQQEAQLASGLLDIRQSILQRPLLRQRIEAKYRSKNTMGYSLNAFLDFDRPLNIFQHLLIGSEGTLAFISEAVLNTVPNLPVRHTGLLLFQDLYAASSAILPFRNAGAAALEIMDRSALGSIENQSGSPAYIRNLPADAAGLLVEFQGSLESERSVFEFKAREVTRKLTTLKAPSFTNDEKEIAAVWRIRAGMFPSVGATRKSGTTVIIEDIGVPVECLADASVALQGLFRKYCYNGIIFGHAKEGNLHFVISQSFNDKNEVERYARFMDDLVDLVVVRYRGALKSEHGTGRNMAPFVATEWGPEAYAIMRRIKELVDPEKLLNPGVILNEDPQAHLRNLKSTPVVEDVVDKCIECGYCEPKCPSRDLTLTPRQRIVVRREMQRLSQNPHERHQLDMLDADFQYSVLDTCAVDGLCAMACPVGIDTGQLVKHFRNLRYSRSSHRVAELVARNFAILEEGVRSGLHVGHLLGSICGAKSMHLITRVLRIVLGKNLPLWNPDMPRPARRYPRTQRCGARAVYFPTCLSRVLGGPSGQSVMSSVEAFLAVSQRARVPIFVPDNAAGVCCGVPFSSKGFDDASRALLNRTIDRFWSWSSSGQIPVLVDSTPCSYALLRSRPELTPINQERFDHLKILDATEFVSDQLLPKLPIYQRAESIVIHPVCSATKLGINTNLETIARACSEDVYVPFTAGCCGFAGDRGFLVPDLTKSATLREAAEIEGTEYDGYFSTSRTCEIGLSRATGKKYCSYIFLLERASRGTPAALPPMCAAEEPRIYRST